MTESQFNPAMAANIALGIYQGVLDDIDTMLNDELIYSSDALVLLMEKYEGIVEDLKK